MSLTQKTPTGTRRLSSVARHLVLPTGIVSTGWPEIRRQCKALGITFEEWQDGLGMAAFGKRKNGAYAASVGGVAMSIPRQVGKTYLVGAIAFALCLLKPSTKVIWTAHHTDTASETFESMREMAQRPKLRPHISSTRTAGNQFKILFTNRSRIEFGARERGFGRGKQKVNLVVLDEAQIMSESALENIVPSMNRAENPLLFMMGTPPRPLIDNGEMFSNKRARALEGRSSDTLYVELSADPNASPDDEKQWAKANPSYPEFTPRDALLRMRETFGDAGFRREAMGIWDDEITGTSRAIPVDDWTAIQSTEAPSEGVRSIAVIFDFDDDHATVAGALRHEGGVHLELIGCHPGPVDVEVMADWLAERWRELAMIAIAGGSPSKVLHRALRDRGVSERAIHIATTGEYFAANAMLTSSITSKTITVPKGAETDALERSVAISDKKLTPQGWRWVSTSPDGDRQPMEAISLALWAARTTKRLPGRKQVLI